MKRALVMFIFLLAAIGGSAAVLIVHKNKKVIVSDGIQHIILYPNKVDPSAIAVTVGNKVEFDNSDQELHNLAQGVDNTAEHGHAMGGNVQSGVFGQGEGYQLTFTKTGTYNFHDTLHTQLIATVVVYDSGGK